MKNYSYMKNHVSERMQDEAHEYMQTKLDNLGRRIIWPVVHVCTYLTIAGGFAVYFLTH